MTTANKTHLGSVHRNQPEQYEQVAAAALTVGMVALTDGDGALIPHGTAGAAGFVYVVKERTAVGNVDETYAVGDWAQTYIPESGEMYRMLVAAGQTVVRDSALTSNGDGMLRVVDPGAATPETAICYAGEAIDGATVAGQPVRVNFK